MTASQEERVLDSRKPLNGNGNITPDSNGSNGNITPDSDGSYTIIDSHFNGNSIDGAHYPATPDTHTESTASEATFPPIAICGMACRLPGGISSPSQLWDFLLNKQDARSRVPSSRYNVDAFYSATEKPGTVKTQYGYFLDEDLAAFDGSMFSMSPMELARCDPQQRLMLEVARECVEEAGETDLRGKEVGVYIGNFGEDWHDMLEKDSQQYGVYRLVGAGDFALANRVSYEMDLRGPSMTIRTACSAALVGLNEACSAIARGDCPSAIVAGASLILTPSMTIKLSEQGVLSPDASCKAFSADANGYARAEAINAVYIKPLAAALRDGNPVRAVIRGTAANSDGKTPGISYPGAKTQEALIRRAYGIAGIENFTETAFVECHGTGTLVGDPIETTAVGNVFGGDTNPDGVYIGSIKPNVGHSEGASGLSSLLKAVLALENRTIPPNIKFTSPNKGIPWNKGLKVPSEAMSWPSNKKERVSVNSFGIGGANAHVVLESAALHGVQPALEEANDNPHLLVYSANSSESLQSLADNNAQYLTTHSERLTDLAYTLAMKREHLPHRAFVVASRDKPGTLSPLGKPPLSTGSSSQKPSVVMVFTGQSAQWPQMGRDLLRHNLVFKRTIQRLDKTLQSLAANSPSWTIESELRKPARTSRLDQAEICQPICTAVQVALVDALAAVGVTPAAVVGHSSGEIAGAYSAGALTAEEAITAAYQRGVVAAKQNRPGGMAAIGMSWTEVQKYLDQVTNVSVACDNGPKSVAISGDADQVQLAVSKIQEAEPGVLARLLKVDKAYHSFHMAAVGGYYYSLIGGADSPVGRPPRIPLFSSVTGKLFSGSTDAKYWQNNLEGPVLFTTAVTNLLHHPVCQDTTCVFVEVGPHPALSGPVRQIQAVVGTKHDYVAAMIRGQNSTESFLSAVGKLHTLHVPIDFSSLYPEGSVCLTDLPRYPWNKSNRYWHETRATSEWRHRKHAHHDLLGAMVAESSPIAPVWRNLLHLDNAPWVRDHRIADDVTFPFSAYVGMAAEAARQISGLDDGVTLRDVQVSTGLVVTDEKPTEMITSLSQTKAESVHGEGDKKWWSFSIASYNEQNSLWTTHCTGTVAAFSRADHLDLQPAPVPELPRKVSPKKWYDAVRRGGLNFGPTFRRWDDVRTSTILQPQRRATAHIANNTVGDESKYYIHPTIVDGMFQLLVVAASLGQGLKYRNNLAVGVEELTLLRTAEPDLIASVEASMDRNGNVSGTGQSVVGSEAVLKVSGVKLAVLEEPTAADTHAAARQVWKPHVDFVPVQELLKPASSLADYGSALDELYTMALAYAHEAINAIEKKNGEKASPAHLQKYLAWLTSEIDSFSPRLAEYTKLDATILSKKITDGANQLSKTPASEIANAISAVALSLDGILTNTNDTHDMLDQNNTLSHLDTLLNSFDMSALINILSHTKPNLRILELGAGSAGAGDTTFQILAELNGCYAKYTVSHSSASMLNATKDRFRENQGFANMDFALLDIEKPLAEQGLEDREYDLVIANNVFHQIDSISAGLNNAQKLLHPEGRLVLHEIVAAKGNLKWTNFVFGTMPSWWRGGETDNRADEPYIDLHRWNDELSAAGFDAPSAVLTGDLTMAIVAKPAILTSVTASRVEQIGLLVLAANASTSPSQAILEKAGYSVTLLTLDQIPSPGMEIIALLDADKPFLETMSEDKFTQLKTFLSHLSGESGLFWLTQLVSSDSCTSPGYAQILGFARVLRSELGIDFAVCQAELEDAKSISLALGAFKKFQRRRTGGKTDDDLNPDMEYLIKGGQIHVPRFSPFDLERELVTADPDKDTITLASGRPGRLNELHWKYKPRESLGEGDVEVEVHSSALSRRDIFAASEGGRGSENLGLAASGIVRCVGPGVRSVTEGDRVVFRAVGALSSTISISEKLMVKIPESLAFGDAAILADVYPIAMYGLIDVGGIQEGQSVLIHDGESEIGLAAIQIARYKGAEVYTTVSSQEAKRLLMQLNVPYLSHDHILDVTEGSSTHTGRTDLFDIAVLLNTGDISEDFLRASWQRVAAFGKLINLQIGRANAQNLDVDVPPNRSYSSVNIEQVQASRPNVMKSHLDNIIGLYQKGYIKPLLPPKLFSAPEISEAFQYAAARKGPWVENVTMQLCADDGTSTIPSSSIAAWKRIPYFSSQASYLLIGGLGGLGRSISVWMVENGARNLVFMSRSAGTKPEDQDFKQELQSMDCSVYFVQGDVTKPEDVKSAVNVALSAGPLKGIHQMSIVLRDEAFERMSWGDWNAAVEPKVIGTWNLHRETVARNINLDFFVFFSAISGLIGQQGQANYASANTFLDAFVEYRHSVGLNASAVQIGPVEDTGIIAVNPELLSQLKATGFYLLREKEVLDAIELAVTSEARDTSFVIGMRSTSSLSSPSNRLVWRRDPRMAVYHNGGTNTNGNAGSSSNDGLKTFLTSARADPSILSAPEATHLLAVEIGRKVLSLLMQPTDGEINTALGLTALGLDSLAGTEMRGWFKGTLGLDMSVVQMMGMGTLETLGKFAADKLAKAYQV